MYCLLSTSTMSVNVYICEESPVFTRFSVLGEKWLFWISTVGSRVVVKVGMTQIQ